MKHGWVSTRFGDVAELLKGVTYKSEDYCGPGEGLIFLTIKCVSKAGGFKLEGIKHFKGKHSESQLLEQDDLLIANTDLTRAGDIVGAPVVVPSFDGRQVTMSMDLSKVVENREKIDRRFLYYLLMTDHSRRFMKDHASGSTVLHLQTRAVPSLRIEIPRKTREQTKIAEVLSTVDRAIEQTEALIAKQHRIKTGLMQDLLTRGIDEHGNLRSEQTHRFKDSPLGRIPVEWDVKLIGDVFDVQLGKMLSKKAKNGKTPFYYLGNKNVQWERVSLNDLQMMDFSEAERRKFELREFDILVCEGGEVGRTSIWRGEIDDCYYQKAIHRLRPKAEDYWPELFPKFMQWGIRKGVFADYTSQTSIAHLTKEKLEKVPMSLPKYDEQERLLDAFRTADDASRISMDHHDKLRLLKTALMQDLLSGKRRVTALLDEVEEAVV